MLTKIAGVALRSLPGLNIFKFSEVNGVTNSTGFGSKLVVSDCLVVLELMLRIWQKSINIKVREWRGHLEYIIVYNKDGEYVDWSVVVLKEDRCWWLILFGGGLGLRRHFYHS